jgi:signal transduction histidine kinase
LNEVFHNIHHAVMGWSLHLATNPKSSTEELGPPVFSEFEPMLSALRKLNSTIHKLEADAARHAREKARILRDAELSQLACQVAHDIRSPLGALKVLEHQFSGVPEEPLRLLRASIGRIRDITNNLLKKNREHLREAQAKPRELLQLIALVVSEKLVQYEASLGLDIHIEAVPVHATFFVAIHESEFKCMISNLLDNAIEAQAELPHVEIRVEAKGEDWVHIRIADHGSGIPADILSQLGERGATFGKEGGNGLGLYHARTWVECWGGSLEIGSQVSEGTRVSITLPRTKELQTGSTL